MHGVVYTLTVYVLHMHKSDNNLNFITLLNGEIFNPYEIVLQ